MINELTQEQEEQLSVYRDKWLKIGLDTQSMTDENKDAVRGLIDRIYSQVNLTPPKDIIWARSPVEAIQEAKKLDPDADGSSLLNGFCYGAHEASWLSFYDYCLNVLGLECCNPLVPHMELAKIAGWWLPFEDVAIVSEKPAEVHLEDGVLHCDGGPAIRYEDGYCVWALHGVRVPQEIAETPAGKLDAKLVVSETNAEIRREIIRKIGVERVSMALEAEVLDKQDDYELVNLNMGDDRHRPYLKMLNPSIGVWHMEGVPPDIRTVKEALAWRNGTEEEPVNLT